LIFNLLQLSQARFKSAGGVADVGVKLAVSKMANIADAVRRHGKSAFQAM